jgi:hypothetical protein
MGQFNFHTTSDEVATALASHIKGRTGTLYFLYLKKSIAERQ